MNTLNTAELTTLLKNAAILEQDGLGAKVLKINDGSILKLFRKRPWFSSGTLKPYSKRFADNAKALQHRGFITPNILAVYRLEDATNATAVRYTPLPGQTLRSALSEACTEQRQQLVLQFATLLAKLHQQGVYFRSAHLGNFLLMPSGELGIIDLADLTLSPRPLSRIKRIRNLRHMCRYPNDKHWLFEEQVDAFLCGYTQGTPRKYVEALSRSIQKTKS